MYLYILHRSAIERGLTAASSELDFLNNNHNRNRNHNHNRSCSRDLYVNQSKQVHWKFMINCCIRDTCHDSKSKSKSKS